MVLENVLVNNNSTKEKHNGSISIKDSKKYLEKLQEEKERLNEQLRKRKNVQKFKEKGNKKILFKDQCYKINDSGVLKYFDNVHYYKKWYGEKKKQGKGETNEGEHAAKGIIREAKGVVL